MGQNVPQVCKYLFLLTLHLFVLQGNAQQFNSVFEPVNSKLDINRKERQVNQVETPKSPLPSNHESSRLSNKVVNKHRENEADVSESQTISWGSITYSAVVTSLISTGLLIALGFFVKGLIKKMRQRWLQKEFSMTNYDAKLSSQFLSDLSGSERSDTSKASNPPPKSTTPDKPAPVVIDIPTARSPIPSNISLTSPKGEIKKTVWCEDNFVQVDLSEDKPRRSLLRRTSSLPSLSDQSSSSDNRDSSRRDAVLLISDDEDFLADLKKRRKKEKKTWKKIIKASQLRAS